MNKVFLIGNLTRDPELSETLSGTSVCKFTVAVNRSYTNKEEKRETDFFNCTAWRGMAENVARYCRKGSKVAVLGSIQIRPYEDNQGQKRTAVDIIVQEYEFLTPTERERETGTVGRAPAADAAAGKRKPVLQSFDDDGDIPF